MSGKEKEIEELKDETDRRELVIREKHLGKEIEKIEKSRIVSDILSIQERIAELGTLMYKMASGMIDVYEKFGTPVGKNTINLINSFINNYISIRKDICYTIGKKEGNFQDKFKDIFPEIETSIKSIKTFSDGSNALLTYAEQLFQIRIFLNRYLQ
jgi:hypothetical protein